MDKTSLVILIIVGIVLFAVGGGLGILYQTQKDAPLLDKVAVIEGLSSHVIPSIVAYGQVTDINGRNVNLSFGGDSLIVPVAQDAQIYSFSQSTSETVSVQHKSNFNQIKKGDYVNINIKLSPDGKIEGKTVVILPPVGSPVQ